MLKSVVRRMKIKAFKRTVGKQMLRSTARSVGGQAGIEAYNRYLDLLDSLMGSSKEAKKLKKRVRDVAAECMVLSSENEFDEDSLELMRIRLESIFEKLSYELPAVPDVGIGIDEEAQESLNVVVKPMLESLFDDISLVLIEAVGASLEPATIRKMHKVLDQLKAPYVLDQICRLNSPTHVIMHDLAAKMNRITVDEPDLPDIPVFDPFIPLYRILGVDGSRATED